MTTIEDLEKDVRPEDFRKGSVCREIVEQCPAAGPVIARIAKTRSSIRFEFPQYQMIMQGPLKRHSDQKKKVRNNPRS